MRRREFITLIGGAAAWPLMVCAQQPDRMRRIGVLMSFAEDDPQAKFRLAAFTERLQQLDWTVGRNVKIDVRWGAADAVRSRRYAAELVRACRFALHMSAFVSCVLATIRSAMFCEIHASRGLACGERARHLVLDTLHCASADAD